MATKMVGLPLSQRISEAKTDNTGTDRLSHSHLPLDPTTITNPLRRQICLSLNRHMLNLHSILKFSKRCFKDDLVIFNISVSDTLCKARQAVENIPIQRHTTSYLDSLIRL